MLADAMRRIIRDLSHSLDKPLRYEVNVGQVLLAARKVESQVLCNRVRDIAVSSYTGL